MPVYMQIDNESTASRYEAALEFVTEGRAVGFPGFSLALCDGTLRLDVDYPNTEPDEVLAKDMIHLALQNFESLLASRPGYRSALSTIPRRVTLVSSDGKSDVEVAKVVGGLVLWHRTSN